MSITLPKLFLDSSDPAETAKARALLGHLDGQTTNPSLVAKNPTIQNLIQQGKKLTEQDVYDCYKDLVQEIRSIISGPISVEVFSTWETKAETMVQSAEKMQTWCNNVYIKFPTLPEGLKAAHTFVKNGGKVNMTLVFDQVQAAAVYSATMDATYTPFVSPFIGRWDDRGFNGLDVVQNIQKMYHSFSKRKKRTKNVEVLGASIRSMEHFYSCIFLGVDIVTVPLKIVEEWIENEHWMPDERYRIHTNGLKPLPYQQIPFFEDFTKYEIPKIEGSLLDEGLNKFITEWEKLISY
ncbi:transaldolase [Candidatus Roizmanbacteria bacterium]|nr:transaldolase [Candidatus Roizmanbacteria bacterium]